MLEQPLPPMMETDPGAWRPTTAPLLPACTDAQPDSNGDLRPLTSRWLADRIAALAPISLAQLNHVALLDRVESKYLLHIDMLPGALEAMQRRYAILEIDGRRMNHYRTLYFDTPDFSLYRRHQAGALNRYKVRSREYVESQLTFLEVKHKTNKKRTVKNRVTTDDLVTDLSGAAAGFVAAACPCDAESLAPCLWNRYTRLTLANLSGQERLTIDLGLTFAWGGQSVSLPGIAVVEVKQKRAHGGSPFVAWAHSRHLRPTAFSKYCVGVSLLYPAVKSNRFKAAHRQIARILNGEHHATH